MMKGFFAAGALMLLAGAVFAQDLVAPQERRGPAIDWKLGTVVTSEYKKLTGTVTVSSNAPIVLMADGVDYLLLAPRRALSSLKTGDTLTVEGPVTTVKSEAKVGPWIEAFKITLNGKETDLRMGRSQRGFGDDDGPRDGNDPFGKGR
jgi:hypothetical protein